MSTCLWPIRLVFFAVLMLVGHAGADEGSSESTGPRTIQVALDGSGEFHSIQEALDAAGKGDTVFVKAGEYQEDVTIHSKERVKLIGEGIDRVVLLGRDRVGVLHVGKWPYGATDIEISNMTINEHGGHAVGMFNGRGIVLRNLKIKGMLFAQQVRDVRVEACDIGGSETTGVQFANSQGAVIGNVIHHSDHGINVAGNSVVRIERNLITRQLFDAVVVMDDGQATVANNTLVKNGGGAAFLARAHGEVRGNIISGNAVGFTVAVTAQVEFSHNAFSNTRVSYQRPGNPPTADPKLAGGSDLVMDPGFFDPNSDDFRLRADSPLLNVDGLPFLGALGPVSSNSSH